MDKVRIGVIGLGVMGKGHIGNIIKDDLTELAAVCDTDGDVARTLGTKHACKWYTNPMKLLNDRPCDAVLIVTPHYQHTTIGTAALAKGYHVLVEKPIGVHKADCERLIAAHKNKKQVFAAVFNQRTRGNYRKLRDLIRNGELGEVIRVSWVVTNWFRTDSYYSSGSWRATWAGEGGGVLLNQCPHQLDLMQWILGMPKKVRGFCSMGRMHRIEVEDEVTAWLQWPNGSTGVFICSTGEAPGTNRLEIAAENGRVVVEGSRIHYLRNEMPVSEAIKRLDGPPATWDITVPAYHDKMPEHAEILHNFAEAVLKDVPLVAPAEEGIHSVELANAMLYSHLTGDEVVMPLDGRAYEAKLKKLIAGSKKAKK
ncbi:MAG TPA: Gfo/Idh/MocA family oxidoreductase [Sedimentisphaerales bacterium]|nr:Gfo/Idh/MocA family oxidoreductase [Sedimentisphaerales bacterium]